MAAARQLGMPDTAIATHATVLHNMKYFIKTTFKISDVYIHSSCDAFPFGFQSTVKHHPSGTIFRCFWWQRPKWYTWRSFDISMDSLGTNEKTLTHVANMEMILFSLGGALDLSKWFYYLPVARRPPNDDVLRQYCREEPTNLPHIRIHPASTGIRQRNVSESHMTLGVWMTPTGTETAQTEYLTQISNQISSLVSMSWLNRFKSFITYCTCWFPAVGYSLSTTTLSAKELHRTVMIHECIPAQNRP